MTAMPEHRALSSGRRWALGGTAGNELLTIATASVLTLLLAAEGITLLDLGALRTPHMVLGLVLIPPLAVKLASTGYRMVRYYTGAPAYREKGPPLLALRLLAPVLVAATAGIFASGVAMLLLGHTSDVLMLVHKGSFIVWSGAFAIHFLSYLPRLLRSLGRGWSLGRHRAAPGAELRLLLVATALGAGVALAVVLLPLVTGWHEAQLALR
ncbi:MAG TPA: hypothetical protein VFT50_02845 [Baekduia sp.]|nr:hypothetical protein [Baekduia sp.]